MRRVIYFTGGLLLAVVILASCSKGGTATIQDGGGGGVHIFTPNDTTAPQLDIYTPAALQSFSNGTSINITGKVTDDYGLYRGSIRITDGAGALVKEQQYEIHGLKSYNFTLNHTVFCLAATDYTVAVSFEDHGTNMITKTVKVKVAP
jgi:phosphate-selective porin